MNLLKDTVKQIDEETLPAAAKLANGVLTNAAGLLDGLLGNAEACVADAITQTDASAGRLVDRLETILSPVRTIVDQGLVLEGTIGGAPVKLTLTVAGKG